MAQHGFLALTEHLPGNDVRMVFQTAYNNLIPFANKRFSKGESQGIEAVGRSLREDDLIATLCPDEIRHFLPCLFVLTRRYLTQMMHSAVDIAVPMGVSF